MKTAQSAAYEAAINAPTYTVASHALAAAMVTGKYTRNGSVFGIFTSMDKALAYLNKECRIFAPAGRNTVTGKQETILTFRASIVETTRGNSQIVFPVR